MQQSYRFMVAGRVQGVGFREASRREAERLGLSGWVRNRDDGQVEGLAEGYAEALAAFRHWLALGPPAARVTTVDWQQVALDTSTAAFVVRR